MRIYIAAPWIHREVAASWSFALEVEGHSISYKWWEHEGKGWEEDDEELARQAENDIAGVLSADLMLLMNSLKSEGKAVEQGVAIVRGIPIIAVGVRRGESLNVFHFLPNYTWVGSLEEAIGEINKRSVQ